MSKLSTLNFTHAQHKLHYMHSIDYHIRKRKNEKMESENELAIPIMHFNAVTTTPIAVDLSVSSKLNTIKNKIIPIQKS